MNNLRPIAQAVRSQGRNQDTQLVHMTPREVAGLQALAMAHGGSLSINPNTGLPEAGFLSDILPAVAGFALGPAGFGLMSSGMAGLAVGGLTALTSGDLGKGVMAGLGAWGGSSLGEGLLGAGNAALGAANAPTTAAAAQSEAAKQYVTQGAQQAAAANAAAEVSKAEALKAGLMNPSGVIDQMGGFGKTAMALGAAGSPLLLSQQTATKMPDVQRTPVNVPRLEYRRQVAQPRRDPNDTSEQNWFTGPGYVKVGETTYGAEGGAIGYAQGGAPITGGRRAILSNEEYLNQYFSPVQTATQMPGVRKASGGIVSLADGGLSDYAPYRPGYKPMTPEEFSKMYFGQSATPTGLPGGVSGYEGRRNYTPPTGAQTPSTPGTGGQSDILTDENGKKYRLEFDSATGTYRKIYEAETPVATTPGAGGAGIAGIAGGGDSAGSTGPNYYDKMEAEIRAANPNAPQEVIDEALRQLQVEERAKIPALLAKLATPGALALDLFRKVIGAEPTTLPKDQAAPVESRNVSNIVGKDSAGRVTVTDINTGRVSYPGGDASPLGNIGKNAPGIGNMEDAGDVTGAPEGWSPPAPNPFAGPTYDEFGLNAPVFETNTRGMTVAQANAQLGIGGGDSSGGSPGGSISYGGETYGGDTGYSSTGESLFANGGLLSLAAGGMAKGGFVVPADVVSALGNGSTDAGLRTLQAKLGAIKPIKGKGDGLSDSIPTHIDGVQPARVADGEAYIDPKTVAKIGGGDMKKGASKLYAMMDKIRKAAHGKTAQQRKVNPAKVVKA